MQRERVSELERLQIAYFFQYKCVLCKQLLPAEFEIDHRFALCLGGTNHSSNLQPLCPECHAFKTNEDKRRLHGVPSGIFCGGCGKTYSPWWMHQHFDCTYKKHNE